MDDQVTIDGYTTGPHNFIKVYTPISLSEVGAEVLGARPLPLRGHHHGGPRDGRRNALTISGSTATFADTAQQHRRGRRHQVRLGQQRHHHPVRRDRLHPRPNRLPHLHAQEQERRNPRAGGRRHPVEHLPSLQVARRVGVTDGEPQHLRALRERRQSVSQPRDRGHDQERRLLCGRGRDGRGHHHRLDHRSRHLHRHLHSVPTLSRRSQPTSQRGVGHLESIGWWPASNTAESSSSRRSTFV